MEKQAMANNDIYAKTAVNALSKITHTGLIRQIQIPGSYNSRKKAWTSVAQARVLAISATALLKRILQIASGIKRPAISIGKTYEVIFIGRKTRLRWIVYALDRESREIVGFNVGRRTNRTLGVVLTSLFLSKAKRIYTDKLKNYGYLIPSKSHRTTFRSTNHIERRNLTLRTHLKRLNRKTICYSRSLVMLFAILRIYFWG